MTREETRTMAAKAPQGGGPLSALVRQRKDELGLTLRTMAERCGWTRTTLATLINGGHIKPPNPVQLEGLASGLDLPLDRVREAAGKQFFGVDTLWTGDRTARAFVRNFEGLSPEDQDKVWELLEAHRRVGDE